MRGLRLPALRAARQPLHAYTRFPVYALFIYAKNERADLSPKQTRLLQRLVADIKAQAQGRARR